MGGWPVRLFICHLAAFKDEAAALREQLYHYGVAGFVAHSDIAPTKEWQTEIQIALATSHALIALMREGFRNSEWTDQEVGQAIARGSLIIPVTYGAVPHGFLWKYQSLKSAEPTALAERVFRILASDDRTKAALAEGVVTQFEQSYSFENAKQYVAGRASSTRRRNSRRAA